MVSNILFIVEGERENALFGEMANRFGMHANIFVFRSNIHALYSKLKEYDFNANVLDVLKELNPKNRDILDIKFAYTYLIFDCDAHHSKESEKRIIKEIVLDNINILKEMVNYFDDETDPTKGKLYINYPSIEAYRDCDSPFEKAFRDKIVSLCDLKKYKAITGARKLSNLRIDKITKEQFEKLLLQNVFKLNYIIQGSWEKPQYVEYIKISEAKDILNKEEQYIINKDIISVLALALFWVIDYFGNRDAFYDELK